jgi:hypothetical protein
MIVLVAMLVAACGGEVTLSADVRAQADDVCAQAALALEEVAWPDEEDLTLPTAAPAIGETRRIHRALLDDLAAVPAEGADRAALDELVSAATPILEALEGLERVSAADDAAGFDVALAEVTARAEETAATAERLQLRCYTTTGLETGT